VAVLVRRQ
jgi:hypothetical protein